MSPRDLSLEQFATRVLAAIGSPEIDGVIKRELERLDPARLPLQQGLAGTNYAIENKVSAMIIRVTDSNAAVQIRAGLFYTGILSGCSCADDPTPVEAQNEYCEVVVEVDKMTRQVRISLANDSEPAR